MLHLVTDTTAYLPAELAERWAFHTVPLKVNLDNNAVDEDKVALAEFYKRLEKVETAPSTSQPAPGEFIRLYEKLLKNGDEVLSVHISSGLSGTPLVAEMAAREVDPERISVVDSQLTSCPLAVLLYMAGEALERGASRPEIAALLQEKSEACVSAFLVEDLEYLRKGGRINGAAKFLGTMLNVRPILHLDKGKIEPLTLTRTRKRGLGQLIKEVHSRVGDAPVYAAVTHILCEDEAHAFAERVQATLNCAHFFVSETGPVIGSHVGPGFIGLCAFPVEQEA